MKIALIIIAVLFLIFAVLMFVPFYVVIEYSKKEKGQYARIRIKYLFFKIKLKNKQSEKEKKSKKDIEKDDEKIEKRLGKYIDTFKYIEDDIVDILYYLSEKAIVIKKIGFLINFGAQDPMYTGMITGALYGTIYNIISFFNNVFEVEECDVKINPDFEKKYIDISSECILKIRNVHIIIMIFKVLKVYFKITKIK